MNGKPVLSSVTLQIFLSSNAFYLGLFMILEILLFIYKAELLPYPSGNLAIDLILLFLLAIVESVRIFIGSKGNLTEHSISSAFSIIALIPSIVLVVYLLLWQVYVLRADVVLCGIMLCLQGVELLLTIISLCTFAR